MLQALSDFISKVTRGEKLTIGGQEAQWKKVAELTPGMMIAVPASLEAGSDVLWDEIVSIKRLSPERVYDIEVEDTHNFVAGHMIETLLPKTATVGSDESPRGPPERLTWFGGIFAHNTAGKALTIFNETGDQNIFTASQSGVSVFNLARVAGTAANGVTFTPGTTGNGPTLAATGSDANIGFNINTKGTGTLTLTSANVSGVTTASSFVLSDSALTSGTGLYMNSTALTTGKLVDLENSGTTLTSGNLLNVASTLTNTTFTGALANIDWSPAGSTNILNTGDLLKINTGQYAQGVNLLNLTDNGSLLFSVSQTAITAGIPVSFTAPGDVSLAYDLLFTNQTASYIKSNGSLYLDVGETWESNDLTFQTYNAGNIIANAQGFAINGSATVSGQLVIGTATAPANIGNFYLTNSSRFGKALTILNQTESQDIFTASASGVTRFAIQSGGNVGIGIATASAKLDIWGDMKIGDGATRWRVFNTNSMATSNNCDTGTAGAVDSLCWDSTDDALTSEMRLQANGNLTHTGSLASSTDADIAEQIEVDDPSIVPGDILVATTMLADDGRDIYKRAQATKSSYAYQPSIIGAVSTSPGILIAIRNAMTLAESDYAVDQTRRALAIAGRIPVNIAPDSEPIQVGDYLTSSNTPGKAMKATHAGQTVGKALDSWTPNSGKTSILMFLNVAWYDPNDTTALVNTTTDILSQLATIRTQLSTDITVNIATISATLASLTESVATGSSTIKDFKASPDVTTGQLVSMSMDDSVEPATNQTRTLLTGVVSSVGQKDATTSASVVTDGNAKVLVTDELGAIRKGDFISLSSTNRGYGAKAVGSGMVVGVALEDFGVATSSGTIHALVRVQWYTGDGFALPLTNDFGSVLGSSTSSGTLAVDKPAIFYQGMTILGKTSVEALEAIRTMTVGLLSFDGIGTSINAVGSVLNVQNNFGAGAVSFFNGKLVINPDGGLVSSSSASIDTLKVRELKLTGAATAGDAILPANQTSVTINNTAVTSTSKVFVTATTSTGSQTLIVTNKQAGSFTVNIDTATSFDIKFDYWIVGVE